MSAVHIHILGSALCGALLMLLIMCLVPEPDIAVNVGDYPRNHPTVDCNMIGNGQLSEWFNYNGGQRFLVITVPPYLGKNVTVTCWFDQEK